MQTLTSRLLGAAGQRFQTPEVALRDAANLVYSAALVAVTRLCGVRALHSVPVVGEGPAEMIARMCIPEQRGWVLRGGDLMPLPCPVGSCSSRTPRG